MVAVTVCEMNDQLRNTRQLCHTIDVPYRQNSTLSALMWGSLTLAQKNSCKSNHYVNVNRSLCEETYILFWNDDQDYGIECTYLASSWIMQSEPDSPLLAFIAASSGNTVWYMSTHTPNMFTCTWSEPGCLSVVMLYMYAL